jgi:membrane protein required for colicin V production
LPVIIPPLYHHNIDRQKVFMNTFDLILILTIVISIAHGWMKGFLRSLAGLPLLISSIYLSSLLTPMFKSWLVFYEAKPAVISSAFLILVICLMIGFKILAGFLALCLEKVDQKWIDQMLGFFWGVVRALAVVKLIALGLTYANMNRLISESAILSWFTPFLNLEFGLKFW